MDTATADNRESSSNLPTESNGTLSSTSNSSPTSPWAEERRQEYLNLFTTGSFYDCSIKVQEKNESKVFKCHKAILASCSKPFEKMLFGSFKEATVDRDYEIVLDKTSPAVFELAMRFVYDTTSVDFKSAQVAVQVYLFAREWMIQHLMKAAEKYLEIIRAEDALKVLEYFVDEDDSSIRLQCSEVLEKSTKQVLSSKSWLEAPEAVVLEVLQMEKLQITEEELFSNLVKWGRAQVKEEEDGRAKIEKCLKHIRFCAMDSAEFSTLCCESIPLTENEKYKVLLGITRKNSKLLPEGFSQSKKPRCLGPNFNYSWSVSVPSKVCTVNEQTEPAVLTLAVEPAHYYLTGVKLHSLTKVNAGKQVHLTCEVFSSENPELCIMSHTFNGIVPALCLSMGRLYFPHPVLMKQGMFFTIKVTYKHTAELCSAVYCHSERVICRNNMLKDSDIVNKVRIVLAMSNGPLNPTVDVCGIVIAKIIL